MSNADHDFEVRRQLVQMQMLYEVGLALSESLDAGYVGEQVLHRALAMVDARAGVLLTGSVDHMEAVSAVGLSADTSWVTALNEVATAWRQEGQIHVDRGDGETPRFLTVVPLRFHDDIAGVLIVADKEERGGGVTAFDDDDVSMLDSFAMQAGAALRNARLHQDLQDAFAALKAAQEKIAQLEQLRALGDLAADLTHSMRHVIGLVIGHADTYLTLKGDPDKSMAAVMRAAEGGQDLIARIERVTRLGVGSERTQEALGEILADALVDAKQLATESGVQWSDQIPESLPLTFLNRADIKEVAVNLLVNAAQAGASAVTLSADSDDGYVLFRVADDGDGIPDDVRDRIFDPFFTTKEGTGSGLGLSIVLRIVEDHGGRIDVESATDEGTTFTVALPVTDVPPPETAGEEIFDDAEDPGRR